MPHKRHLILLILLIAASSHLMAQYDDSKLVFKGVNFSAGQHIDWYFNNTAEKMANLIKPSQSFSIDLNEYEDNDYFKNEIWGSHIGVNVIFLPRNSEGYYLGNRELRIGIYTNSGRNNSIVLDELNSDKQLTIYKEENTLDLSLSYFFKTSRKDHLQLFFGSGSQLSFSLDNKVYLYEDWGNKSLFDGYASNYLRVFAQGGVGVQFWKLYLQLEGNAGFGFQYVHNGDVNGTASLRVQANLAFLFYR